MEGKVLPKPLTSSDAFFNELGKKYEDAFAHDQGLHRILDRFIGLLDPNALVLDCGCGTGKPVADKIVASGRHLRGIDLSQTMVDLSRQQVSGGEFEICNMLEYRPAQRSFDGIVAVLSLFELSRSQLSTMAARWAEWLRPGGYLLIGVFGVEDCQTTPDMFDADGQCATGIPFRFMGQIVSMTLFTKPGWSKLLEDVGFSIVHVETDVFSPPPEADCDDEPHYYVIAQKSSQV